MAAEFLLIDAGSTNLRFVRAIAGRLADIRVHKTDAFRTLGEALAFQFRQGVQRGSGVFIAVAGAPRDGKARLTNADFEVDCAALEAQYPDVRFHLLNDIEALAHVLKGASPSALVLRSGVAEVGGPQAVIAPGTGLGATFVRRRSGEFIQATEAGHMTAAPPREDMLPLFQTLMKRKGRLAADENLLSSPGLVNIWSALAHLAGKAHAFDEPMTTQEMNGGKVLLINQRHLLTFWELPGVPLEADYELVFLMEMAMAGNPEYPSAFNADLQNHRFDLIIAEPLNVQYQGRMRSFGEENDAWVDQVSAPVLCHYQPLATLDTAGVVLYVPSPNTCP